MPTKIAKIELSFEPELNFCNFGGSKMSLQEHSKRQGECMWSQSLAKSFLRWDKILPKVQKFKNVGSNCHWHADKIAKHNIPFSVRLESVKNDIFSKVLINKCVF